MSLSPSTIKALELIATVISLTTSSGVAAYSFLVTPAITRATDTSPRTGLAELRPLFEGGKYVFPPAAMISAALYTALAYAQPEKLVGFSIAAVGSIGIIPFTTMYMIPKTNNLLLDLDDRAKEGDQAVEGKKEEVKRLMRDFYRENVVRAGMYWIGGIVGLYTILN